MQRLLEAEYPDFASGYVHPPAAGLRTNILKISPQALQKRLTFDLKPIPWVAGGFWLQEPAASQFTPGKHPYHAAGLYYLQEPSAMAVAAALAPQTGERILDLCAAPGGKSTQIAAQLGQQGLLVANEIHPRRAWEVAENLERWGAHNAVIVNESPARLAERLEGFFDRVLVDAPCSGEGMFRKSAAARKEWSPELAQSCAQRQSTILEDAIRMVCPGGILVYSTCTFNPAENEGVIALLLQRHPEVEILSLASFPGSAEGRPDWVEPEISTPELAHTLRLWPHHIQGEGHFIALLRRNAMPEEHFRLQPQPISHKHARKTASRRQSTFPATAIQAWKTFAQEFLNIPQVEKLLIEKELSQVGSYLYAIPEAASALLLALEGLHIIHPGWWLGSIHAGQRPRFEPAHALALGLNKEQACLVADLSLDDPAVLAYLRGESLRSSTVPDGWGLVTVDGFPLGWGKSSQNTIKNYYPHGLRWV